MGKTFRYDPEDDYDLQSEEARLQDAFDDMHAEAAKYTKDKNLEKVIVAHMAYESKGGMRKIYEPHSSEHDGIDFYRVGHNASHEFYMGYKDGKFYAGSFGDSYVGPREGCDCDSLTICEDEGHIIWEFSHREVPEHNWGYLGHY